MTTSLRISRLLSRLQCDPLVHDDMRSLIRGFSAVSLLVARSNNTAEEKWRLIEEQRLILLRTLEKLELDAILRGTVSIAPPDLEETHAAS